MVPLADTSALLMGGTSLLGSRMAVNRAMFGSDGLVGESSQETANTTTSASIAARFM
jgi:hypothetical protein